MHDDLGSHVATHDNYTHMEESLGTTLDFLQQYHLAKLECYFWLKPLQNVVTGCIQYRGVRNSLLQELLALLDHLDKEGKGHVSVDEFVQGLQSMRTSASVAATPPSFLPPSRSYRHSDNVRYIHIILQQTVCTCICPMLLCRILLMHIVQCICMYMYFS